MSGLARRMEDIQLMKQKKTAEEIEKETAAYAESLQKLSDEDMKQFNAIEAMREPVLKKPPLYDAWAAPGVLDAYMDRYNH
jgi:hypothetical protein